MKLPRASTPIPMAATPKKVDHRETAPMGPEWRHIREKE
jgi:hypothetical protein